MSFAQCRELRKSKSDSIAINKPKFISRARFMKLYSTNSLGRHITKHDFEAFHLNSLIAGSIRTFAVRTGSGESETYYEVSTESSIDYLELRKMCLSAKWKKHPLPL